jgi:hypothetical protein
MPRESLRTRLDEALRQLSEWTCHPSHWQPVILHTDKDARVYVKRAVSLWLESWILPHVADALARLTSRTHRGPAPNRRRCCLTDAEKEHYARLTVQSFDEVAVLRAARAWHTSGADADAGELARACAACWDHADAAKGDQ